MTGCMPSQGILKNTVHSLPVRVYYEDTDAGGIVYHANYLRFFERARSEMLRVLGIDHIAAWSHAAPGSRVGFAIRWVSLDCLAPSFLDDTLQVHSQITHVAAAYVEAEQWITRQKDLLVRAHICVALIDENSRPRRLPADWRKKLKSVETTGTIKDETAKPAGH